MAGASRVPKEPLDLVSQNKIFCETVQKELRCQRLHTEYGVNPLKGTGRTSSSTELSRAGAAP